MEHPREPVARALELGEIRETGFAAGPAGSERTRRVDERKASHDDFREIALELGDLRLQRVAGIALGGRIAIEQMLVGDAIG
ncbi:MAG: hypothetical protein H0X28_13085 [Solirubrobacterales bacterium]|nr:hypothetical protein [Solirubrobacterales bacterium]